MLKIYVPDSKVLECNSEYVMTCDTGMTFKALAEKLFDVAGITKEPPSKYRFVPAIPAHRTELKIPEKLTSKYKISYALSKRMIGVKNKIIIIITAITSHITNMRAYIISFIAFVVFFL